MIGNKMACAVAALLLAGGASAVEPELLAEQVNIDGSLTQAVGGASKQRLAQAFTLSRAGYLSHVMLPMVCDPEAKVTVTIERVDASGRPNGVVLATQTVPGHLFTSQPTPAIGMRMIELGKPPLLAPGQYAFTLNAKGAYGCGAYVGPGDAYPGGKGWFISPPNPPATWLELWVTHGVRDLAFQVYVRPL